jgi:hypothetical protein
MSDGSFFVNSDGLDTGKDGFEQKGNEINDLALRIKDLINPDRVAYAAGNDQAGRTFAQSHIDAASKIHDGISTWADVVSGTSEAIGGMSNSFRKTDEVVTDASTQLGKSYRDLDGDIDKTITDLGGGGGGKKS